MSMQDLSVAELLAIVVGVLLALAGAINTVGAAVEKISKARAAAKATCVDHDERLDVIEADMGTVKRCLDNDKKHLEKLDSGNRATQEALFALLSHSIDGNNVSELKKAQVALHEYLIYGHTNGAQNDNGI